MAPSPSMDWRVRFQSECGPRGRRLAFASSDELGPERFATYSHVASSGSPVTVQSAHGVQSNLPAAYLNRPDRISSGKQGPPDHRHHDPALDA